MGSIKLFEQKQVRSQWIEKEERWYFSVVDVVAVLTDSDKPRDYWYRIKEREKISGVELSTICRQLKLEFADGKKYETDCAWFMEKMLYSTMENFQKNVLRHFELFLVVGRKIY